MRLPRRSLALDSPSTHLKASRMLVLPDPFGPTMAVIPLSKRISVFWANVLKPARVIARRCTGAAQVTRGGRPTRLRTPGAMPRADRGPQPGGVDVRHLLFHQVEGVCHQRL